MMNHLPNPQLFTKIKHRLLGCLLLLGIPIITSAQTFKGSVYDKKIISINPAVVFSGTGDVYGFGTELSFLKTISKHFFLQQTLASHIVNGTDWTNVAFGNQTGLGLSSSIGYSPFVMKKRFISLSVGVEIAYINEKRTNGGGEYYYYYADSYERATLAHFTPYNYTGVGVGLVWAINYHKQVGDVIFLNSRFALRSHTNTGNIYWFFGAGIGIQLNQLNN